MTVMCALFCIIQIAGITDQTVLDSHITDSHKPRFVYLSAN